MAEKTYNIKPVGEFLLLKIDPKEEKTESGIYLPTPIKEGTKLGKIMAMGDEVNKVTFKVGQTVILNEVSGVKYKGYHFTTDAAIYGILEEIEE